MTSPGNPPLDAGTEAAGMPEDELRRHRHRKLLGQLQAAGWKPDQEGLDASPVRLWLYSVSLDHGPRLVMQAGAQLYRDMQSGGGVIGELAKDGSVPGDDLAAALRAHDGKAFPAAEDRQCLGMYLAWYASSTRTWQQRPSLDEVGGVHVVVFDWASRAGHDVLRPACCSSPVAGPMNDGDLASFFGYVLAAHVRQHPQDEPACLDSAWYPMRPGRPN